MDSYPVTIEDAYRGSFHITEKTRRLDAVLSRHVGQWVLLVDSDEFVELPYGDIPASVRELETAGANVMAAPMLQRMMIDGSLETPPVIEDPFKMFPLCSADLYRRMGVKGDIFKFPLFFCADGTRLAEGGNHHPAPGLETRATNIRGVTHHFKFRRTVSQRLENRIHSEHPWRHESIQFREYLLSHYNRLPLEESFLYSRDELFRRGFLKQFFVSGVGILRPDVQSGSEGSEDGAIGQQLLVTPAEPEIEQSHTSSALTGKTVLFVLPESDESEELEYDLPGMLRILGKAECKASIVRLEQNLVGSRLSNHELAQAGVKCQTQPRSLRDWLRLFRGARPDIIVFCYVSFKSFPWKAPLASLLAGVRRRVSIQYLVPPPLNPVEGRSPAKKLRRLIGRSARHMLAVKLTGHAFHRTICVSSAARDSLVQNYQFSRRKTITIHNGVSTRDFAPCESMRAVVRGRFDVSAQEILLICAARNTGEKDIEILIHAVSRVLRQGIPCKCIIVGDFPHREEVQRVANSLGMTGYVCFEEFQSDIRPYLQAGSAFILTSRAEGLSLRVLEAMACALPCIVADVSGNAEAVKHEATGLVISPDSVDEAENAILYLATHPHERAAMASKSREIACQCFNVDRQMDEMANAILN